MELKRSEELDIIETVTGPTPWVSLIIIVPKSSDQVRICVDMREANKAVKREKHLMSTIDDLVADLNGATVFSKLDLSSGYHQSDSEDTSASCLELTQHPRSSRTQPRKYSQASEEKLRRNMMRTSVAYYSGSSNLACA